MVLASECLYSSQKKPPDRGWWFLYRPPKSYFLFAWRIFFCAPEVSFKIFSQLSGISFFKLCSRQKHHVALVVRIFCITSLQQGWSANDQNMLESTVCSSGCVLIFQHCAKHSRFGWSYADIPYQIRMNNHWRCIAPLTKVESIRYDHQWLDNRTYPHCQ